jgi:hypothetical protein
MLVGGNMEDWQMRVIEEKKELDERRGRLHVFMQTEQYEKTSIINRYHLYFQSRAMEDYSLILDERIAAFK